MRGSRPRVYLAGPITGLSYAGATDWRVDVAAKLLPGIVGVSPMRGKEYLASLEQIGGTPNEAYMVHAMSTPKSITARDRYDTTTSDAVLMNVLGATRVSIGTMIEAGWADAHRVPLILVIEAGNVHSHAMLDQVAGYVVETLDEAVHVLKTLFWREGP